MSRRHTLNEWALAVASDRQPDVPFADTDLVLPRMPASNFTALLSGLLPDRDHNSDLVGCLHRLPACSEQAPLCSVFAADPFINGRRLAATLLPKGYRRVLNWPTTAQYGRDFCNSLDSVQLGPRQELENLGQLAAQGMSVSVAVCFAEAAIPFLALDPEYIFLAPSVDLWTDSVFCRHEALHRCALLSRMIEATKPIVLMVPRNSMSLQEARDSGASAVLFA